MSPVKFLRINGFHSREPVVLASVGPFLVRWNTRRGWTCQCDEPDGQGCDHVEAVADLVHDRVFGEDQ